jgi:Protein of unknown function (DUF742)
MSDDELSPREIRSEMRPYLAAHGHLDDSGPETGPDSVSRLRPYLLTGGRAEPVDDTLEIEAQVMATEAGTLAAQRLPFEHSDIVRLCIVSMSVAEVAARLRLHIGVARVLVADLADLGYLYVERPNLPNSQDPSLIERVIRGLEAIR